MPTYQLTVTRYEKNLLYKKPKIDTFSYSQDDREQHEKDRFIETVLNVSLSEEQFEIIKKATLENWK